ncbi:MAG: DUF2887 domain-containing protein [Pseudanabaenaceae cyanobacterium]
MRTDTLFYQIFQTFPTLLFELLRRPPVPGYTFTSVEVKEKSFRFDGIFLPPPGNTDAPIYLEFIRTVLVYKFPHCSREEIERMFTLDDLRKTRVFQEIQEESLQQGRKQEALALVSRQISRKFGTLPQGQLDQLQSLSLDRLEELAEVLLDFTDIGEFYRWLDNKA